MILTQVLAEMDALLVAPTSVIPLHKIENSSINNIHNDYDVLNITYCIFSILIEP